MADLMVKLSRHVAEAASRGAGPELEALEQLISSYGAKLMSPIGDIGDTDQFFVVGDVTSESGERLRRDLERLNGVEAAYFKPADELP